MGVRHWVLLALLALPLPAQAVRSYQAVYFPPTLHKASVVCTWGSVRRTLAVWPPFFDKWFSEQLSAAREPSLWEASRTAAPGTSSYRFTWLRSFHAPVIIRIDQDADGEAILTAKMLSGRGGYDPGHVSKEVQRPLTSPEMQQMKALFVARRFADFRTSPCNAGADGAQWIVETRTGRRYRAVYDVSLRQGAVFDIGMALVRLSGLNVSPAY